MFGRGFWSTRHRVLTGRVADRPVGGRPAVELGVELAHITICGDRAADISAQLAFLRDGRGPDRHHHRRSGPTADDMTVATVAGFCGRELVLDTAVGFATIARDRGEMDGAVSGHGPQAVQPPTASRPWCPMAPPCSTPVGTAGRGGSGPADGRRPARPAQVAGHVARRRGHRKPVQDAIAEHCLPPGHRSDVRGLPSRAWPGPCAPPSRRCPASMAWRSPPARCRGELEMVTRYGARRG